MEPKTVFFVLEASGRVGSLTENSCANSVSRPLQARGFRNNVFSRF